MEQARNSDTLYQLLAEPPQNLQREEIDLPDEPQDDLERGGAGSADNQDLLREAGRALQKAANPMSLVMVARTESVLLTGDATKEAVDAALGSASWDFSSVVTPHHGGDAHFSPKLKKARSQVWASSAGGHMSARITPAGYDSVPGLHLRTDVGGDIVVSVRDRRVAAMHRGPLS